MGFFIRAALWVLGAAAVVVAAFVVYNAFFGGPPEPPRMAVTKLICPPQVSIPPRQPGAPVDDVAGIRLGYNVADAQATLLCRNPHYDFDFEQIWHTAVPSTVKSRQRMAASNPPERISLGLAGDPGKEIVYAVFQDIEYGESAATPTPQAAAQLLLRHYGGAHDHSYTPTRLDLWWLYAPDGKPITTTAGADMFSSVANWVTGGGWGFDACRRHVTLDPLASPSWNPQCGLSIHARIDVRKGDPERISRYRIVAIDQAKLGAAVENYRDRVGVKTP